jgi:DNA-directed RNA polymerase specialized sigma24 family protein
MSLSPGSDWTNARLVEECLRGNERAWHVLVDRYKNLIYSIALRYGAPHQDAAMPPDMVAELEQEQLVQDAIAQLPPRCREMMELLFFESPPLPYAEVAQRLHLATGSIGFIRGRCLERLKKILEAKGF